MQPDQERRRRHARRAGSSTIAARHRDGQAVLSVRDTGPGIPEGLLERVFEPFFSTKTGREGTGLGLSICRDILQRSGGSITVANGDGGGAVFTVNLPCRHRASGFREPVAGRTSDDLQDPSGATT